MEKIRYELHAEETTGGMLAVMVKCTQYHHFIMIDTNQRIFPNEWDAECCMVIGNPNSASINKYIRKVVYELESFEFSSLNDNFNLNALLRGWFHKNARVDFYSLMEAYISGHTIKEGTIRNHIRLFELLHTHRQACSVGDLTEDFVQDFYDFLLGCQTNGRAYKKSTIMKYMKILRVYYNYARKLFGTKVPDGSFDFFKPEREGGFMIKALSDNDIRVLENYSSLPAIKDSERLVLEQFLLMSYTGMRYSDFIHISNENIVSSKDGMWINYISQKTGVYVHLPISVLFSGKGERIIYKYSDDLKRLFNIGDNTSWNKKIDRIVHMAGVNAHVTAHVARHTFASRLLNKGVPVTTIQKAIGHRNLNTTMMYAKMDDTGLMRQLSV